MLLDAVKSAGARTVCFIGGAKNAGKTTALNSLMRDCGAAGETLGVVSVGLDGEERDLIFEHEKPRITLFPGQWVATVKSMLEVSNAQFDVVEDTGRATLFGSVMLARAKGAGEVVLTGVQRKADLEWVRQALLERGCKHVAIDGAYHRWVAADPRLTDGAVFCVGASMASSRNTLLQRVQELASRVFLPAVEDPRLTALIGEAESAQSVLGVNREGGVLQRAGRLVNLSGEELRKGFAGSHTLLIPGAVTDAMMETLLLAELGWLRLVVADASRWLVSLRMQQQWKKAGGQFGVARPIRVVAFTINPWSYADYGMTSAELRDMLLPLAREKPVVDCHLPNVL